ncbi:DUF2520 domain-containing protein [Coprothermobacteraceae bacterium]|nr:DUF2520 domain-containing protein [Coprothermobacteraceae bacterium]
MRIALIGAGRVAGSFAPYLASFGEVLVWSRRREHAQELAQRFGLTEVDQEHLEADLAFVSVSDDALPELAKQFSGRFESAIHTSGFHSSSVLRPMAARVGSIHPWLPIPEQNPDLLKGSIATWEGDEELCPWVSELAAKIPLRLFTVDPEKKVEYHAAAVMLSNYTSAFMIVADKILQDAGIAASQLFVEELLEAAIENFKRLGPSCLTGPAVRKDLEVIKREAEVLGPDWGKVYTIIAQTIMEGRI